MVVVGLSIPVLTGKLLVYRRPSTKRNAPKTTAFALAFGALVYIKFPSLKDFKALLAHELLF